MNTDSGHHRIVAALVLASVLLVGAADLRDAETLLREGNAAFARGDYAEAAALYEQAEKRTTEPALVAFNRAAATYQLAMIRTEEKAGLLGEAEQLYRCCLSGSDPHRPWALYGLGNCLLHKTSSAESLKEAIACYQRCLREAAGDGKLTGDARQNLELARLRLLQFQKAARESEDKPPEGDNGDNNPPRKDAKQPMPVQQPGDHSNGRPDPRSGAIPTKLNQGDRVTETEERPLPGVNHSLPTIPDRAETPPLSPQDAAEHLDRASRRILEEGQAHRQRKARPPAKGIRDW
jgi:tetratricopeptide (TPR) repeat protein